LEEYAADHDYQPAEPRQTEPQPAEPQPAETDSSDSAVREDHLLLMHLLYTGRAEKRGAGYQEGYASLDSLREVSGLPAWRVWELIEELQERDLVSCIWVSRGLRSPSAEDSRETSADLRFLRGTQAGLTSEGLSYPSLADYRGVRQQRRWERPDPKTGQARPRQASPPRAPSRKLERIPQASGGYHLYRPREQAARRLLYLVCLLCVIVLAAGTILVLAIT
jgi:hypothetical protein